MISVTKQPEEEGPGKKLIATTDKGDYAYWIQKAEGEHPPGSDGYPISSFSNAVWRPNFHGIDRMTMFIAGNPGAGKSYLAKEMIKLFPKKYKILLFTALEESDGNFEELSKDKNRLFKVNMSPENLETFSLEEIRERTKHTTRKKKPKKKRRRYEDEDEDEDDEEEDEDSEEETDSDDDDDDWGIILLFDDVDKIKDSTVAKMIFGIMEDALANGRGHKRHDGTGDIHVICTSHALNDYRKTKYTLENSNYVALFPGTTTNKQMSTMFEKLGLDEDLCKELIKYGKRGDIRSVIIHKIAPMYIIFGPYIMLL